MKLFSKKPFQITFLFFLLSFLFVILHNLVFAIFKIEEGLFFILALIFIFLFFLSLLYNLFFFAKNFFSYSNFVDPLLQDLRIFVLKFSEFKTGDKILDLGCGTGDQAIFFAKNGALVYGIDINPKMIDCAQKSSKKEGLNINFQQADGANLPFPNSFFDITLISLVLHEIESQKRDRIISEMKRVTKKGGSLIFVDFNFPLPKNLSSFFVKAVEFLVGKENWKNFKSYIKERGLWKLLERNKLTPQKIEYLKNNLLVAIKVTNS
ncbi:class I SAM-dependent methyltransferase [Candidatus Parcubacteria bacterium]|nr:class I SAM-dependent methyltransferase [Candidatus Parcubacteria bacterium]